MTRKLAAPLILSLVLGALLGGTAWYLTRESAAPSRDPGPGSRPASSPASSAGVATDLRATSLGGPVPQGQTVDVSRSIRMPDGKYLPALNGVLNPPNLTWPKSRPYSPVVSTERDTKGQEWYVHADGSKSTMTMIDMKRGERVSREAVSYVATPQAALPVRDDPAPKSAAPGSGAKR